MLSNHVFYNIYPNELFQNIKIGITASRYAYSIEPFRLNYNKISPIAILHLKKNKQRNPINQSVKIRNINIIQDDIYQNPILHKDLKVTDKLTFNDFTYLLDNSRPLFPYNFKIDLLQNTNFIKGSAELNYRITYQHKKKGFDIRLFAGKFLYQKSTYYGNYNFRMSGQSGWQDYLYDNYYLGRSDYTGIASQQFTETDGAFKILTGIGQTNKWIVALNLKTSIPGKLPIRLFADLGTYSGAGKAFSGSQKFVYDAGFDISLIRDYLEIFLPVFVSSDIKTEQNFNGKKFIEKIRFTLYLDKVNPFEIAKSFMQ